MKVLETDGDKPKIKFGRHSVKDIVLTWVNMIGMKTIIIFPEVKYMILLGYIDVLKNLLEYIYFYCQCVFFVFIL